MEYRIATLSDLDLIWDKNIKNNPTDLRWVKWKEQFISYNKNGEEITFVCVNNNVPVGELTVLLSPKCKAVLNKPNLCNGKTIANLNALRIEKKFEGKGYISKLVKFAEQYCKQIGIKFLTIGVEALESRNLSIYLHWGYTNFVCYEVDLQEDNALVLYYQKQL